MVLCLSLWWWSFFCDSTLSLGKTCKKAISFTPLILKVSLHCQHVLTNGALSGEVWIFIILMFSEGHTDIHTAFYYIWDSFNTLSCTESYAVNVHSSFELIRTQFNVVCFLNKHSCQPSYQSAVYGAFSSLDTDLLFVIESLSLLQARIWSHSVFAFSFVKACWRDCQTCRIKNKSIYVLRTNSQTSNKRKDSA